MSTKIIANEKITENTENKELNLVAQKALAYMQDNTSENLVALASQCVNATLNKIYSASGNYKIELIRRQFWHDLLAQKDMQHLDNNAYSYEYNKDGELVFVENTQLSKQASEILSISFGNGMDLLNVAIMTILEQEQEHPDLLETYKIKTLDKRVVIRENDSAKWVEKDTSALHEVFLAIRREVEVHQSTKGTDKYIYLDELVEDEEGNSEVAYRRLHSNNIYATLDGVVKNSTYATVDTKTVNDIDKVIKNLNLSAREMQILKLRIKGYGNKAISSYLGISESTTKSTIKQIRNKAIAKGYTINTK